MSEGDLGDFGDARRGRTGSRMLAAMQASPTICVHALAETRSETIQFGRFLDNAAVSVDEMVVHVGRRTGTRVAGRHVLAVQDTTELHFANHTASKRGFGAGGNGRDPGLFLHPVIAIDATHEGVIGLVGDRERDIYDQFARRPAAVHLLCRAAQDRMLATRTRLFATCAAWPEQDRYTIAVPAHGSQPARTATVALRWGEVALTRPATASRSLPQTVTMRVIDVGEVDATGPTPVHWCLLTTHAVESIAQAREIVRWYQARWTIEQVFRTLKSAGAQAETSQLTEARRFVKLAVLALIAAVRIVQIVIGRDPATRQPISDAADPEDTPMLKTVNAKLEGRTALLKNPHDAATLAWFAWIVARLGGWSGYTSKGYKPAGPKTIARGLIKLDGMIKRWNLAHSANV